MNLWPDLHIVFGVLCCSKFLHWEQCWSRITASAVGLCHRLCFCQWPPNYRSAWSWNHRLSWDPRWYTPQENCYYRTCLTFEEQCNNLHNFHSSCWWSFVCFQSQTTPAAAPFVKGLGQDLEMTWKVYATREYDSVLFLYFLLCTKPIILRDAGIKRTELCVLVMPRVRLADVGCGKSWQVSGTVERIPPMERR